MKIKVEILNYDSEWVTYCNAQTRYQAECAVADLQNNHSFYVHQIRLTEV